jgi:hypothetical protein
MKEFLNQLSLDGAGRLRLVGRRVHAAVNDRFCLNVVHRFGPRLDLGALQTMNRCFLAGADKGVAYTLLNEFLAGSPAPALAPARFARAFTRQQLLDTVRAWLRAGRKAAIKPQGTGLGHGIEFFLSAAEDDISIARRVDASVRLTEAQYGLRGGAFPYTVCEYLDAAVIGSADHPLCGHKYELRVVVYRDGMKLKAFPSIVKIASEPFDPVGPSPLSLINNITTSSQAKRSAGVDYMMPLANRRTLALLGLGTEELMDLCAGATRFVRHVLDRCQDAPEALGLPAAPAIRKVRHPQPR